MGQVNGSPRLGRIHARIRRCPHPESARRSWWELEWLDSTSGQLLWHREVPDPKDYLYRDMHVQDLHDMVQAANYLWERGDPTWTYNTLLPPPYDATSAFETDGDNEAGTT